MKKELIVPVFVKAKEVYCGWTEKKIDGDAVQLAKHCSNQGADAILVFDLSEGDAEHDASIAAIKEIAVSVDIPVYGGGNIKRTEDVKKLLYAGCRKVFLNYGKEENAALTKEVSERFGKEKILACVYREEDLQKADRERGYLGGIVITEQLFLQPETLEKLQELNCYVLRQPDTKLQEEQILEKEQTAGMASLSYMDPEFDFMERKHELLEQGILVNTYTCEITWDELKCGRDGLLPVVVQDYKTQEVLMMAYMNQEAYEATIRTGRMTYWSRSREELWVKGMTSGHIQYVKELRMDCDQDTLLAKVLQIGAACHTGNRSCFYRTILKKEYDETNPLKVFEDVFAVIQDRKIHPKEGSYTNYLFEKGIDKILKKVGEEATEIVIAAKNPDSEELKYEISDFLYHMMVLMAERGVSWDDITKELARR